MKICCADGCNKECVKHRRYCHEHYLKRKSELYFKRKIEGKKIRTTYKCVCIFCHKEYEGSTKTSLFCSRECMFKSKAVESKTSYVYDSDNYKTSVLQHRNIAIHALGRKMQYDEIVHHIDCDSHNNDLHNLIVISRKNHAKLHNYLNLSRCKSTDIELWKSSIHSRTIEWLNENKIPFIELSNVKALDVL